MSALSHVAVGLAVIAANIAVAYSGVAGPWWVHGIIGGAAGGWTGLNLSRAVFPLRSAPPSPLVAPRSVDDNELRDEIARRMSERTSPYTWVDILGWLCWMNRCAEIAAEIPPFDYMDAHRFCPKCGGNRASVERRQQGGCGTSKCPLERPYDGFLYSFSLYYTDPRPRPLRSLYFSEFVAGRYPEHLHHTCGCGWQWFSLCADHEEAS